METATTIDLPSYHWIVINSSAGKDSQAMTDYVCELATLFGVLNRVIMVHCDLGEMEWPNTKELAEEHAKHYGIPFHVVRRNQDLLDHIEERGMFPDSANRFCTSDHKRDQVSKLFTEITGLVYTDNHKRFQRKVRILNCMGMRADESPARVKLLPFRTDDRTTNGKRHVDIWLPLHQWTAAEVWARIKASGVRHHYAYDLGMPRVSCCFCIFANREALLLSGKHNRALLDRYVAVEAKINHRFKNNLSLKSIADQLDAGYEPQPVADWRM